MGKSKYVVTSLNRATKGEQGTLFRVPNPGSEFDVTFTSANAREVTLAFCQSEKAQYEAFTKECSQTLLKDSASKA